ncbi:MAG: tetratricopeptide repeat protein [Bacteroidetes bacterium]|nr:tetratricopeptide repeat protein [Bacteroidota bacterium]
MIEINEQVEDAVDHALKMLENGNFWEGKRALDDLMQQHSSNHMVQYAMGVYYAFNEDIDTAIQYFNKALTIFPYFVEACFNKATAYQKKIDIPNMVKAYREVIEIGDTNSIHVLNSKKFLRDLENRILQLDGINLDTYIIGAEYFDEGFKLMTNKKFEKAIHYFKECLKITPNNPQSHGNSGICYAYLGQKSLAIEALDKEIELDPNYEPALVNRMAVKKLKEGEKLDSAELNTVNYYSDYPLKKKSYIQELFDKLKGDN